MEQQCEQAAAYRYTWPASAMGLHLQLITIEPGADTCR